MPNLFDQLETDYGYKVLDKTASGGQAQIFKVRHTKYGYVRALRVIDKAIAQHSMEDKVYKDFIKECTTLLRLGNGGHPNIIRVNKPIFVGATALIEMDHIEGADLHDILLKRGCFSYQEVIELLKDTASALAYCHQDIYQYCINHSEDTCVGKKQEDGSYNISDACKKDLINKYKVIHNDIHTKNIRLRNDGKYILLDFGLSFTGDKKSETSILRGGIYEYIAPEKSERGTGFGEASDIYSLGIVLYECLTGEVPFPLQNPKSPTQKAIYEVEEKHKNAPPASIWEQRKAFLQKQGKDSSKKDYPDWLDVLVMKCLAKNTKDRFQNGKELDLHLQECINKELTTQINEKVKIERIDLQKRIDDFDNEKKQIEISHQQNIQELAKKYSGRIDEYKKENTKLSEDLKAAKITPPIAPIDTPESIEKIKKLTNLVSQLSLENSNLEQKRKKIDESLNQLSVENSKIEEERKTLSKTVQFQDSLIKDKQNAIIQLKKNNKLFIIISIVSALALAILSYFLFDKNKKYGLLNSSFAFVQSEFDNQKIPLKKFESVEKISNYFIKITTGDKSYWKASNGNTYDDLGNFSDGLAWFSTLDSDLYGYINTEANVIITPKYIQPWGFSNGKALVKDYEAIYVINKSGERVNEKTYDSYDDKFQNNLLAVEKNGKWGFLNNNWEEIVECQYDKKPIYVDYKAIVERNGINYFMYSDGIEVEIDSTKK